MLPVLEPGGVPVPPSLPIPEIRDYQKINAELVALLDQGHRHVRLEGADGQRLLASGLAGAWDALIEVVGRSGPEMAAGLDSPGLVIVARGATADGAGLGLRAGRILIIGDAGDVTGYSQAGGILVVGGSSGHRPGLRQSGGTLVVFGQAGRLAGDRQSGGFLFMRRGRLGSHPGHGRSGGRLIELPMPSGLDRDEALAWHRVVDFAGPWIGPANLPHAGSVA